MLFLLQTDGRSLTLVDTVRFFVDLLLHLDEKLIDFGRLDGALAIRSSLVIIFCETGLVVTPFLPEIHFCSP